jgi:alkylation response protein AidB-like acyl-CoA dehydrogenase
VSESDEFERRALREAVRKALEPPQGRPAAGGPPGRAAWQKLADDLGLAGVSIPESLGGSGLGRAEEMIVHEEMGRVLSGLPFSSTVGKAAAALRELGSTAADGRLAEVASGALTVAAVLAVEPGQSGLTAEAGRPARITGVASAVIDAANADALLVLAADDEGAVLGWLPADAEGVRIQPMTAIDLTRSLARVEFDRAPATVLARGAAAAAAAEAGQRNWYLALAAESVGLAARALEMTVAYVKVRHQFGRPIGSFQAVKHRCADMLVQLETARSALAFAQRAADAADAGDGDPRDVTAALAVARMYCGQIPFWIANETIHLHGGIGFTWEHPAHLYYRRAKSNQVLLDPQERQRRVLATLIADRYDREEASS